MNKDIKYVIGIGPVRSGTTWLFEILKSHPRISVPIGLKETNFWLEKRETTDDEYLKKFSIKPGSNLALDISPNYISDLSFIERNPAILEKSLFIINLRDPNSRISSMIDYQLGHHGNHMNIESFLQFKWAKNQIFLSKKIEYLIDKSGRNKIFFCNFSYIKNDPKKLYTELCSFLKIPEDDAVQELLFQKIHRSFQPRNKLISKAIPKVQHFIRFRLRFTALADYLKNAEWLKRILEKPKEKKNLSDTLPQELIIKINNDTNAIENLTGLNLNDWKI